VRGFIEHFAFLNDLANEEVVPLQALLNLLGGAYQQIYRERRLYGGHDFQGFAVSLSLKRQDEMIRRSTSESGAGVP
jgi:hypothetical protein